MLLLVVDLGHHTGEKWEWGALNDLPADIKAQFPLLTLTTPEIKEYLDHCLTFDGFGDRVGSKLPNSKIGLTNTSKIHRKRILQMYTRRH